MLIFALAALVSATAAVVVQDPPDFSGTWMLSSATPAGAAAPTLVVRQTFKRVSIRGKPLERPAVSVTIERHDQGTVSTDTFYVGAVGGTVGGVDRNGRGTGPNGQVTRTTIASRWKGDQLALERASYSGPTRESGPYIERTETWSLDTNGELTITATERRDGRGPISITARYKRKG
jgi:hypothetical protein